MTATPAAAKAAAITIPTLDVVRIAWFALRRSPVRADILALVAAIAAIFAPAAFLVAVASRLDAVSIALAFLLALD